MNVLILAGNTERKKMLFPRRQYVEMLDRRRGNGFVKIITGIRRCGKSFLLFNLFRRHLERDGAKNSQFIEIILDDERFEKLRNSRELAAIVRLLRLILL